VTPARRYTVRCVSEQRLYVVWDAEKSEPVTSTLSIEDCNEIARILNEQHRDLADDAAEPMV
jgi:hypothetical protein